MPHGNDRTRLFGTNGVRGVVNRDLTPELVLRLCQSIATFFGGGSLLTGCDGRVSSRAFLEIANAALNLCGCQVSSIGLAPTPAIQYLTRKWGMDGAVAITASHNPPEYNGVKVMGSSGIEIAHEVEDEIENILRDGLWKRADWHRVGRTTKVEGALAEYSASIRSQVDSEVIKGRKLKVVVDAANGVGSLATPTILRELGCLVLTINSHMDGTFPGRHPEPTPSNLGQLADAVVSFGADMGIAHDGDADRAIFVDEKGQPHWGDKTFALIARHYLMDHPGSTLVTPISSSRLISDIAEAYGGRVEWTKVGSVYVSHVMERIRAPLGGEENGGIFYGPHIPVRDGAMAAALVAEILAETGKPLSGLVSELPSYFTLKDKVPCPEELKGLVVQRIAESAEGYEVQLVDGVKVWLEDRSWILVRPSGTEPLIRIFAEARSGAAAERLLHEYMEKVDRAIREML